MNADLKESATHQFELHKLLLEMYVLLWQGTMVVVEIHEKKIKVNQL
jgi:hypothetical protein